VQRLRKDFVATCALKLSNIFRERVTRETKDVCSNQPVKGVMTPYRSSCFHAIHAWHNIVHKHQAVLIQGAHCHCLSAVASFFACKAKLLHTSLDHFPVHGYIIDN